MRGVCITSRLSAEEPRGKCCRYVFLDYPFFQMKLRQLVFVAAGDYRLGTIDLFPGNGRGP